jgi:acetylglutamate kinase
VKIGGQALEDEQLASSVAEDLALMSLVGIRLLVVHGGGPQVSAAMKEAGIEPRFIGGLRVTDEATIEVAQRVLVGSINGGLVGRLNAAGLSAVGVTGGDGATVTVARTTGPQGEDLGYVGRIESVQVGLLNALLGQDYTPVLASIAPDGSGAPHNVNADAVAGAVAVALDAAKLVFLTNVEGLYRDLGDSGSLVSETKASELRTMLASLSEGMRPKVSAALDALDGGVGKTHILDGRVRHALLLEVFTDQGIGTQVLP